MISKTLTKHELNILYKSEIEHTFPPAERKPFSTMAALMDEGAYEPIAFWEDDELVAYALLWTAPETGHVLLDYLGVTSARRGCGIGGQVLTELDQATKGRWDGILAEVEAPQEGAPEYEQQVRRIRFYERCGYRYAGYDVGLFGVHYRMYVCNGQDQNQLMRDQEAIYRTQLNPNWYQRVVQMPLKPGEAVHSWTQLQADGKGM